MLEIRKKYSSSNAVQGEGRGGKGKTKGLH